MNRLLALLGEVVTTTLRAGDRDTLFREACRIAVETGGLRMAWIGLVAPDGAVEPAAAHGHGLDYLEGLRVSVDEADPRSRGPTGRAILEGRPQVMNDIAADGAMRPWREAALRRGFRSSAAFPLVARGRILGALNVYADVPNYFEADEVEILDRAAQGVSFALELLRHRLDTVAYQYRLREKEREVRLLLDSTAEGLLGLDPAGRCTFANDAALRLLGYEAASDLLGQNLHALVHHTREDGTPHIQQDCRICRAVVGGEIVHADDDLFWRCDGTSFPVEYWARPVVRDGHTVGVVLTFLDITERRAMERDLRRRLDMEARLNRLAQLLITHREAAPGEALAILSEAAGAERAGIYRWSASEGFARVASWHARGAPAPEAGPVAPDPAAAAWLREAMAGGDAAVVMDVSALPPGAGGLRISPPGGKTGALLAVPLDLPGGAPFGFLAFSGRARPDAWHPEDVRAVRTAAAMLAGYYARREAEVRLDYLSRHDPVTGLPNIAAFRDHLRRHLAVAKRQEAGAAVLLVELANFADVVESRGHETAERVLRKAAGLFTRCLREEDTVARTGAHQFGVLLPEVDDPEGAVAVGLKLVQALTPTLRLKDGAEVYLEVQVGAALFPENGADPEALIRSANVALNRARCEGPNNVRLCTAEMNRQVMDRLRLEGELRAAVERREFTVHFQPKVDVAEGRATGVEALVRWQRPGGRLEPPGAFIPMLEKTGLIVPAGRWVLEEACRRMMEWRRRGLPPLALSVNLSGRQFAARNLVEMVADCLQATGFPPGELVLEVTETMAIRNLEANLQVFNRLRGLGVRIALDDFGKEYSSFGYLKQLPVDELKIDRAFLANVPADREGAAILRAMVAMAHALNLKITAEGVETGEQWAFLKEVGCDEAQGFLFGHPEPPEALEAVLVRSAAPPGEPSAAPAGKAPLH
nr:EAL domain-containing protein [Dissulfurirhabdus thermomarina]